MRSKNLKINIFTFLAISILIYIFLDSYFDKRSSYESFLIKEYNNIPNYSSSDLENIPKPEHPDLAKYQDYFKILDPKLKYIPYERLKSALKYKSSYTNPKSNLIEWVNTPSNMGGRTRTLKFDPNDPNKSKVWSGGVTGGLWYNDNILSNNSNWNNVNDLWDNLVVSCIAFDPNNPNVMYVGTGEANTAIVTYRESSGRGVGLWKSVDSGITWQLIPSTEEFSYITDIEIDSNSNVYIGVVSGTYYGLQESLPSDGLYRSSNFGNTWEQVLPNINGDTTPYAPSDIEISSNGRIFVGTMKNINGNGGSTILYSDTGNKNDWFLYDDIQNLILNQEEFNIPGRVVLSSSKTNSNVIYAVFGSGYINSYGFNYSYGNYIIKSTNNGNSWDLKNIPNITESNWATLAWHALTIKVDPSDENTIYVGGLDLYKSSNSGNSWDKLSDWALMYEGGGDKYVHADIHSITFRDNNPNEFAITSDGGIFYTNNGTASSNNITFSEKNNNYNTLQYYTGSINPLIENTIFAGGLQDNGTLIYSDIDYNNIPAGPLTTNNMISGGDGAYCFYDINEPELLITSTYYNRYYLFINNEYINYFNGNNGVFINPADYNYLNNTLYANAVRFNGTQQNRIYIIRDIDTNPQESTLNLYTGTSVPFSMVKYSNTIDNSDIIYLGTQSGYLYKASIGNNNNFTVDNITSTLFPTANISSLSEGLTSDTLLVTFSNYGISSIFTSVNGGSSWTSKESNLPDMPIRSSVLNSNSSNNCLIATEIGIWETDNLFDNNPIWYPHNNFPNVRVDMLSLRKEDNLVLASTHGRGQYYGYFNINNDLSADLNNDNDVNILDVIYLVNIILNDEQCVNCDINNDNSINVLDIINIVNIILSE